MKSDPMDYAAKQAERKRLLEQAAADAPAINPGFTPPTVAPAPSTAAASAPPGPTEVARPHGPDAPGVRPRAAVGQWHRQGISLYPSDDEIVRKLDRLLNTRKIRLGVNPGPSLYARVGLKLLDDIVTREPDRVVDMLRAMVQTRR